MKSFHRLAESCSDRTNSPQELYGERTLERSVQWDGSTVKSVETDRGAGAGLRILSGDRMGFAYANESELDADDLVDRTRSARQLSSPDESLALPVVEERDTEVDRYDDPSLREPARERIQEITRRVETLEDEEQVQSLQVSYRESMTTSELYLDGEYCVAERLSRCWLGVWAICGEGEGTRTGYSRQSALRFDELRSDSLLQTAVRRARRQLGSTPPESQTGPTLLAPDAASGLLRLVVQMLDGEAMLRGRSAWDRDRLGKEVGSGGVTLRDDPGRTVAGSARTFDAEGQRIPPLTLIDGGELQNCFTNHIVARRSDSENTRRAARSYSSRPSVSGTNTYLEPGEKERSELEEQLGEGPVITSIQPGSGLDAVAGHFSVGARGYRLENGEEAQPFREGTLSGEVEDLLNGVVEVGQRLPRGYPVASPALLVDKMSLGGD